MSKPDWAERLQRTFNRKYEAGYAVGYHNGYKEVYKERERIIKLLDENQRCRLDGGCNTKGYCFCIARQLIKGEK